MPKALNIPEVKVGRSAFPRTFRDLTTFNNGQLIPLMVDSDIVPGDTVQIPVSALIRMQTPIYPVMDDMYIDITAWFVPHRLVWKHFKEFWGENNTTYWEQPVDYEIPQIKAPESTGWAVGSLADYFGLPTGIPEISVSHLPFRAYSLIWNEFWRDENLKEPIFFNDDETTLTGKNYDSSTYDYTTDTQLGALPARAAKLADYFTKALPAPQKGVSTVIPMVQENVPIITTDGVVKDAVKTGIPLKIQFYNQSGNPVPQTFRAGDYSLGITEETDRAISKDKYTPVYETGPIQETTSPISTWAAVPANLFAAMNTNGITVNALRQAVSIQRYLETIARSGSRYIETLASIFAVKSSDARLQRPEFLGGKRIPINMTQVMANANAASGTNNKVGNTGAMSQTIINDYLCTKSFEEHGTLMILACCRHERTYQQGVPRMWLRKKTFDFYNRALDHIGETSVYNEEIYAQSEASGGAGKTYNKQTFGYQPAFEDMRLGRKYVTGEMRSAATTSLDAWHYADEYNSLPTLSSDWIDENQENVDRTISVTSATSNQLFGDFVFKTIYTRGMSMYGTPGFMDHM